jgi:hypothetical protein
VWQIATEILEECAATLCGITVHETVIFTCKNVHPQIIFLLTIDKYKFPPAIHCKNISGPQSQLILYLLQIKCITTWLNPKKLKAQKARMQKSWVKTMLTAFFDAKCIIHNEYVLKNRL